MVFGFFLFFFFFLVTHVDFLTFHASRFEFIMLGILRFFLHFWHVKTNTVFLQALLSRFSVMVGM